MHAKPHAEPCRTPLLHLARSGSAGSGLTERSGDQINQGSLCPGERERSAGA